MFFMSSPSREIVEKVLTTLQKTYTSHPMHEAFKHDVFHMLIAVVLSQRATDAMTIPVAQSLFRKAPTPQAIVKLPLSSLEAILRPIGFFHAKATALKKLSQHLIDHHRGRVPHTEAELLAIPQVGRKTANILLTLFFNTPQIAVDVHVHRITQRLGWLTSKTPEETEGKLTKLIPKHLIPDTNRIFVRHGQEICKPVSPKCSICPVEGYCKKVGVARSR
jgi:endonuclease-3